MTGQTYDIIVIGGGINGAGIAAAAAGRRLRVLLVEAGDLGGATSSASSKLIHGGLRYLEHFEFGLVRAALAEREILLRKAPHIVRPLQFILPQAAGMRPAWMLRAGLFLYDHLSARQTLGPSRTVDLAHDAAGRVLKPSLANGFSYWDCWVDDARLVVLNAMAARERGGDVLTRTPVTGLDVVDGLWRVALGDGRTVNARAVINAAGPWVEHVAGLVARDRRSVPPRIRLVKGSHIVVPRIAGADRAYLFQNADGRVVFMLPFEDAFTLIGTTETSYSGDPRAAAATDDDRAYLIAAVNRFLATPLVPADILWDFAGVRPLTDDGNANPSAVSRDYRFVCDREGGAPILHVVGGKITTYRRLAEKALEKLSASIEMGPGLPADAPLPGGDVGAQGFEAWFEAFADQHPAFERATLLVWARRYGTRLQRLLGEARTLDDLGGDVGGGLSAREIVYLAQEEFATRADDIIWRRTKAGLRVPKAERAAFAERVQAVIERA